MMKTFKSVRWLFTRGPHSNRSYSLLSPRQRTLLLRTPASTPRCSPAHRRGISTWQRITMNARSQLKHLRNFTLGATGGLVLVFGTYYITDTRAGIHQWVVPRSIRWIYDDAEKAHEVGIKMLETLYRLGLHPRERGNMDEMGDLGVEIFGQTISNPLAISAGLDKNGDISSPLFALGPSIVEIGGITPLPQEGNPKPRVFRIPSQNALINRYGLNSRGAAYVASKLRRRVKEYAFSIGYGIDDEEAENMILKGEAGVPPGSLTPGKLLAIQIAKNSNTRDDDLEAVKRDYVTCVKYLAPYADILVINVSSPNQKGLRNLQKQQPLLELLTAVVQSTQQINRRTKPAIMVKVSPDEDSDADISGICHAIHEAGIDGVIVGNTTKGRPRSQPNTLTSAKESRTLMEQGGYSGPLMFPKTLSLIKKYRQVLDHNTNNNNNNNKNKNHNNNHNTIIPPVGPEPDNPANSPPSSSSPSPPSPSQRKIIFASGGICTGDDVKEVLDAGASVAMVYTTLSTKGVGAITSMKERLCEIKKGEL